MPNATGPAVTAEDVKTDLKTLRDDVSRLTEQVSALLTATGEEAMGEVKARFEKFKGDFGDAATEAGERGRDAVYEAAESVTDLIEENLRERPMTVLALAVGLGFLFGTSWRR